MTETVFRAYYSGTSLKTTDEKLQVVHMCQSLRMPYCEGGFVNQPAWFIATSLSYLSGKSRAEEALQKKANKAS